MSDDDESEPYLEEVINDAIGPVAALLPAAELALLRQTLRDAVKDDPDLRSLYRAARPRPVPVATTVAPSEAHAAPEPRAAPAARTRRKGGAA